MSETGNHLTRYEEKDKYQAVTVWIRTGNMMQVERETGIKYRTLREWKKKPWWAEKEKELQSAVRRPMIKQSNEILLTGMREIMDRFKNGDEVVIHSKGEGQIFRIKPSLKDISKVMTDISNFQDRMEKIEANITAENQGEVQESSVEKLAEQIVNVLGKKADNAKPVKPVILADNEETTVVSEESIKETLFGGLKEDGE